MDSSLDVAQLLNSKNEFYRKFRKGTMNQLRVAMPGIIQSFDPAEQTVTVQPALRETIIKPDQTRETVNLPLLLDVPVYMPRGGNYILTTPIKKGDECLVIFSDMCIDAWWSYGGIQNQLEKRRHDLSDAIALVGIWSQPNRISNYSINSAQLRNKDGTVYVELNDSGVNLVGTVNINGKNFEDQLFKKVDTVDGKQLSTENYTTEEKNKLAGIQDNANDYVHPDTHPGSMITEDSTHRWTTDTEKANWNNANSQKHTHSNKNILDIITQALVDNWNAAVTHISDTVKHITSTERTNWNDAYDKEHTHNNLSLLETITQTLVNTWNSAVTHISDTVKHITSDERTLWNTVSDKADISHNHDDRYYTESESDTKFATKDSISSAGYGDMLKSVYDTNNDGAVDNADTVEGKHASDFAPGGYGLGGAAIRLSSVDLNTVINNGWYDCQPSANYVPDIGNTWHKLLVICSADTGYVTQLAFSMTNNDFGLMWIREKRNGTWSSWGRIAKTDKTVLYNADRPNNVDLNNYTITGVYTLGGSLINIPNTSNAYWGSVIVSQSADVVSQVLLGINSQIWYRSKTGGGGWTAWERLGIGNYTLNSTPATAEKTDLIGMINEVFTDANNGKTNIYNAIVGKGITPASQSFANLVNAINAIGISSLGGKRYANGSISGTISAGSYIIVPLNFTASRVIIAFTYHQSGYTFTNGFILVDSTNLINGEPTYFVETTQGLSEDYAQNVLITNTGVKIKIAASFYYMEKINWIAIE